MILVDVNLLVYAHVSTQPEHERARAWFESLLSGTPRVGIPWPSILGFLRIVSNPRVFAHPVPLAKAWRTVETWLSQPCVWMPAPTEAHARILGGILSGHAMRSGLVPDAHLAALAIEHGLRLCSTDGDFARFRGVRWENPLAP